MRRRRLIYAVTNEEKCFSTVDYRLPFSGEIFLRENIDELREEEAHITTNCNIIYNKMSAIY